MIYIKYDLMYVFFGFFKQTETNKQRMEEKKNTNTNTYRNMINYIEYIYEKAKRYLYMYDYVKANSNPIQF